MQRLGGWIVSAINAEGKGDFLFLEGDELGGVEGGGGGLVE